MVDMISQLLLYFCIGPVRLTNVFFLVSKFRLDRNRVGMDNFPTFSGFLPGKLPARECRVFTTKRQVDSDI